MKAVLASYLGFWARLLLGIKQPSVIGVTGSAGKTTTKEAIVHLMVRCCELGDLVGRTSGSAGNMNTETGLPLAILRFESAPRTRLGWLGMMGLAPLKALILAISPYPRYLVLEYAADQPGDIARLTKIARPDVAVVTAIGPAHLELLGTVEQVAIEKLSLVRAMESGRTALLAREIEVPEDIRTNYQIVRFDGKGERGARAAAQAVLRILGVDLNDRETEARFEGFTLPPQRMNMLQAGAWWIIDDAYNANPLSMRFALEELSRFAKEKRGRRVAILGDMLELGRESLGYHQAIGKLATTRADLIVGVGPAAKAYLAATWYPTAKVAARAIQTVLRPHDVILVKGSRGVAMEQIVEALVNESKKDEP